MSALNFRKLARTLSTSMLMLLATAFLTGAPQAIAATTTVTSLTVDVQMPDTLVTEYGGVTQTKQLVTQQFAAVSGSFAGLTKPVNFSMRSFTVFSGPSGARLGLPHSATYLMVYSENSSDPLGWYGDIADIEMSWPYGGGVFASDATDGLRHELGHARGAIDVYAMGVDGATNPISHSAYTPPTGVMTYPYGTTVFDEYSRHVINAAGATTYPDRPTALVDKFFPSTMQINVTSNGRAVSGATVQLYGVNWFSNSVENTAAQTGKTARNGYYKLSANPFKPNTPGYAWDMQYCNFLVKVTSGRKTTYTWMPLTTVGNWYFNHPGTPYTLNVKL